MISIRLTSFPPPKTLTPMWKESLINYYNWLEQKKKKKERKKKVLQTEKVKFVKSEFLLGAFPKRVESIFSYLVQV